MNEPRPSQRVPAEANPALIHSLRDQQVILDGDLARIYGVETRALNQAIKRNHHQFPEDFVFDLSQEEILRISQSVTSLGRLKFSKRVRAFTEHGALMAAMVLNSARAVAMSVYVIRAFVNPRTGGQSAWQKQGRPLFAGCCGSQRRAPSRRAAFTPLHLSHCEWRPNSLRVLEPRASFSQGNSSLATLG